MDQNVHDLISRKKKKMSPFHFHRYNSPFAGLNDSEMKTRGHSGGFRHATCAETGCGLAFVLIYITCKDDLMAKWRIFSTLKHGKKNCYMALCFWFDLPNETPEEKKNLCSDVRYWCRNCLQVIRTWKISAQGLPAEPTNTQSSCNQ